MRSLPRFLATNQRQLVSNDSMTCRPIHRAKNNAERFLIHKPGIDITEK